MSPNCLSSFSCLSSFISRRDSLMVSRAKEVGPRRFRESAGRYYEDFELGHVYEHRPGPTPTEADHTWFSLLTMNQHPQHIVAVYCPATHFCKPLGNSALTLAIATGLIARGGNPEI